MKRIALVLLALWLPLCTLAQEKPAEAPAVRAEYGLAVYKLGEQFANDEKAGETIDSLCAWLGRQVDGATFVRRGVRNKPDDALKLLQSKDKPVAVAIVSPGFYFKHKDALKLTALAEARRGEFDGEQYALVGSAAASEYPQGAVIATSMSADTDWLNKAVLPAPAGSKPVTWKQHDNLFDAAYAILDAEKGAPAYVLADRVTLKALQADADLKGLAAGLKSELLPQDLVVEVDGRLGDRRDALKKALGAMDATEEGRKLGANLQSAKFPAPADARLKKVAALYE
ncbi:MAG: hypothetical protein KF754_15700 [Planctomycetes bacterium]|nr:hypothetical protein [Planctomycetota bacterium]